MTTLREEFARKSASDFMERHFAHLRDGRKEYTEAEVRNIMLAMQAEIDSAFQAGRLQGLGEASAKVRAILADCEEQDIDDPELESIAQDIDQLKDRT